MSSLEEALEKAARIREARKSPHTEGTIDVPSDGLEVPEAMVDSAVIDDHLVSMKGPSSVASEQYKRLRARILSSAVKDDLRTFMITSAEGGEGKTVTAINLAATMSNDIDSSVFLVDSDLRKPSIHQYIGIEPERGLSDYLLGKASLADVLVRVGRIILIPGGEPPANAAELIASEKMRLLVNELKERCKNGYIIFDSSPMLVTADPLSLGNYMDGIIFVIQEGRTSQKAAAHAVSLMKGWNVLGAVFNNVPHHVIGNLYPYRYSYGKYSYGKKPAADKGSGAVETE